MNRSDASATASPPIFRVFLFGEFAIERLVPATGMEEAASLPCYERISHEEWRSRGPAIALLKLLLCRHRRRAMKDELVEALWPETGEDDRDKRLKRADRAFDAAASVLRRVLYTPDGTSLLTNVAVGDGMRCALADQERLWVDADAFEALVTQALRFVDAQGALPARAGYRSLMRRISGGGTIGMAGVLLHASVERSDPRFLALDDGEQMHDQLAHDERGLVPPGGIKRKPHWPWARERHRTAHVTHLEAL